VELKIEYMDKKTLKPYARNAKLHPAEQVEQIKKSIEQFGFNDPIAVYGKNEIIEGHGRLLAVMEMDDVQTVPVIRLDHLSDEERRAYSLVHNKLTMNSGFDYDLLHEELRNLTIDMRDFDLNLDEEPWTPVSGSNTAEQPKVEPQFTPNGVTTGEAGGYDPYLPETYNDADIQEYIDNQERFTVKKRVIITYLPEQEEALATMLRLPEIEKVLYDFEDLV
jgi:hypothetical protein